MFCNLRLAHYLARERLANLYVILADWLRIYHRIEGCNLPDVRDANAQTIRQISHAQRIKIATTLALHYEHQRQYGRTLYRIFSKMTVNLGLNLRREHGNLAGNFRLLR